MILVDGRFWFSHLPSLAVLLYFVAAFCRSSLTTAAPRIRATAVRVLSFLVNEFVGLNDRKRRTRPEVPVGGRHFPQKWPKSYWKAGQGRKALHVTRDGIGLVRTS
jgi:hypothetical protein